MRLPLPNETDTKIITNSAHAHTFIKVLSTLQQKLRLKYMGNLTDSNQYIRNPFCVG